MRAPVPVHSHIARAFAGGPHQSRPELRLCLRDDKYDAACAHGYLAFCFVKLAVQFQLRTAAPFPLNRLPSATLTSEHGPQTGHIYKLGLNYG